MPTALEPIALAALAPLIVLVLFLGLQGVRRKGRRRSSGRAGTPTAPPRRPTAAGPVPPTPAAAALQSALVPVAPDEPTTHQARIVPVATAPPVTAGVPPTASLPRKVDLQLARRYARPATAAWKAWFGQWHAGAPAAPIEAGWVQAILESFLALARPIVIEMEPDPDSTDLDAAAAAVRAIYLHPDRFVMIQGRWYVLEAVAPRSGAVASTSSQRWQMGPAAADDPGGHRLITPTPRAPRREAFDDAAGPAVVQALTIQGLVETTGLGRTPAARMALSWSELEDIGDDQVAAAVSDAVRVSRALGVAD